MSNCEHKNGYRDGAVECDDCGIKSGGEPKLTPEMLNGWWKWKKGSSKLYKIGWIDDSLNVVVVGLSEGYIPVERLLEDWKPISAEEVIKILEGE